MGRDSNPGGSFIPSSTLDIHENLARYKRVGDHCRRYEYVSSKCHGRSVLELGCGHGLGRLILGDCGEYVGVDVDVQAVRWACANVGRTTCSTSFATLEEFETIYPNRRFQIVLAFEVLEHVENAHEFLGRVRSHLAPGGVAFISTPNGAFSQKNPLLYASGFHVEEYSFYEFKKMLSTVGLVREILLESRFDNLDCTQRKWETGRRLRRPQEPNLSESKGPLIWARLLIRRYFNGPLFWRLRSSESCEVDSLSYTTMLGVVEVDDMTSLGFKG